MSISKNRLYVLVITLTAVGSAWLFYNSQNINTHSICFIKNITGIPCPSCGATRSILALSKGEILNAIWINPLGIIMMPFLIVVPIWVTYDLIMHKDGLHRMYLKFEAYITKPFIRNSLIVLFLMNWAWNILKQL